MFKVNDIVRLTPDSFDDLEKEDEGFALHKHEHRHAEAKVVYVDNKSEPTLFAIRFIGDYRPFQLWVEEHEIESV